MPKIIPIRELKNTASISKYVEETNEPVFVTKNGYGSMVIMSLEVYEREFAKKQTIGQINDSLEDENHSSQKNDDIMLLNEMKVKYGK
ncbi:MAG: type II toxin-antitoxin system Phd/YefM family antitoxin [Acholeplasmataceae bacterium]|nr:type II toxin-antitoxin system Phd/YefM family antitoxin [Acholeplasmataceae bacterium]